MHKLRFATWRTRRCREVWRKWMDDYDQGRVEFYDDKEGHTRGQIVALSIERRWLRWYIDAELKIVP